MKKFIISLFLISGIAVSLHAQTLLPAEQDTYKDLPAFRIAINGGGGYRLGRLPDGIDAPTRDYLSALKWGFSYGAEATYFFGETMGIGVKYHNFHASNKAEGTLTLNDGTVRTGTMSDNQAFSFLGPIISYRAVDSDARNAFYMTMGGGYMTYKNDGRVIDPVVMKGNTLGAVFELGYDYGLSEHLYFGATLSLFSGKLSRYSCTQNGRTSEVRLDKDHQESLSHVDLTIGLRYYL